MEEQLENLTNKSSWGGARSGTGRKVGSLNKATADRKLAAKLFEERVLKNVDKLFDSQLSLALGNSYLYRIDEVEEGKRTKKVHTLVKDHEEIKAYLDGETDGTGYYYVTTEKPDTRSIDSLLDRTFGKATQKIEATGKDGTPLVPVERAIDILKLYIDEPENEDITTQCEES